MPNILFDSMSSRFKNPVGAVKAQSEVTFHIRTDLDVGFCEFQYNKIDSNIISSIPLSHIGNEGGNGVFKVVFTPECEGIYFYRFKITTQSGRALFLNRGESQQGVLEDNPNVMWQLTVFEKEFATPDAFLGSTMYQIFPDRFFKSNEEKKNVPTDRFLRSDWGGLPFFGVRENEPETFIGNDYFGGDLKGIEEKLPYLKSLNVSVIYLNPIFEAHSNHRYNTADYFKIDPLLGDDKDFISLTNAAHKLGMRVILDGVFSHVGDDSIYFNKKGRYDSVGAYQSFESEFREWFDFDNSAVGYKSWWGVPSLPETRENSPSFTEFICGENGVLAHWLSLGADGFRLDVADELPDEFLDAVRKRIKTEKRDALLIGEVWEDATTKHSHGYRRRYLLGKQLDGVMNYPFKNAILDFLTKKNAKLFLENIYAILNNYPAKALGCSMNFLSTHDTVRAVNVLSKIDFSSFDRPKQAVTELGETEYNNAVNLLKIAFTMLFTLNGMPCIYYGDEAGLCGWADPFNRMCYPWGNENIDLRNFVQKLSQLRCDEKEIFSHHNFKFIGANNEVIAYKRFLNNRQIITVVNLSNSALPLKDFCDTVLLSTDSNSGEFIPPNSAMIGLIE